MFADHRDSWSALSLTLSPDLSLDRLSDGQLTRSLADLCQVGSRETVCDVRQDFQIYILRARGAKVNSKRQKINKAF